MYFNRKNAEQKNWRMIKKGKHFLFGCSLVFAVGAALVAPSVKADTVATKPEAGSTTEATKSTTGGEDGTYGAPAAEVVPSTPVAPATVVAEEKAEKPATTTENSKDEAVATTDKVEKAKEADSIQAPEVTVVYDPSALTDEEKAKVVAAVKAANPTATDVQVQADGSVVVTFVDGSSANLTAAQTIKDGSLVAKPRSNRAARSTATRSTAARATEGAENLDYTNKDDVEGYAKVSYQVDNANNTVHWTVVDNGGRKGNSASGYVYFTIPKDSVGAPTNWRVVQTDKSGKVMSDRNYWKDNDGAYVMGAKGRMDTYTGTDMTNRLTNLYKETKNPKIKGNEAAVAAQTAARSQALYTLTADIGPKNPSWTITFDTPILDKSKPFDFVAGLQGTGVVGGRTNIMTGFTDNFIDNASSKFQAVAVKEKYTAKVGGSFAADPATYVTNKAGTPEFPNNYRGATSFKWKDGQAPTATEAGTYTKTVVVTYPAHYNQAPQEVTITFEVEGETPKPVTPTTQAPEITSNLSGKASTPADVTVKAPAGSTVKLYNKDGVVIGEAVANDQGVATVHPTNSLPEGEITATSTPAGGSESAKSAPITVTKTPVTGEGGGLSRGSDNTQLLVSASHITVYPGDKVKVDVIAAANAIEHFWVPQNPTAIGGVLPVGAFLTTAGSSTYRQRNAAYQGTVAETQKAGDTVVRFAVTSKKNVTVTRDLKVTVLESAKKYEPVAGAKVEVADVNNVSEAEKTKIIDAAKAANTSLPSSATYSVDEKGNLVITYADKSTDKIAAAYLVTPAKDTEAPAKPVVNTDLTGKAGTKTPVEVTAEKGSTVALYDKDNNKIGEATAGENGKATITPTVDIPAGNVTAKATDAAGNTSVASDPATATAPAALVAPTVEIPYSNKDTKEVYVYGGEENSFDIKFKDDSGKIASATVKQGGNKDFGSVAGEADTINTQYGFKANVISSETPATADAPAVITYRGTPAATDGLTQDRLTAATKGENPAGLVLGWRYATATDTDGALIENKATGGSTATDPGAFRVVLKPQNQKYDIATPTEKVTVADPANVTEAELAKIKEKVQLEYSQNNDDANLADKKGTPADKTNKIQSVTKDDNGNLVVTYADGSQDKKPLSEFVNVAPTVELPYSNQANKQIYVYTGENTDLTFKASDNTAVKDMYVRGPGGIGTDNTANYGFTTGKIENSAVTHGDGTVSGATATIKMTGVTTLKAPNRWTSFVVANDNDNAPSNTDFNALDINPNATQTPGYVQFIVKSQTDKYDIATPAPADKVEVADPTNVTDAELDKIKEKLQLEYNKKNDDANISKDTPVDKDGKIQSVTKDADGNLVVTYTDGSTDKKPLLEFVTKKPTDADKNTPVAEEQSVNKGDTPDAKKSIGNVDSLPEGTTVAFKNPVDTTTPGDKDATVVVTYPDGSKDEVPVKVTVKDPSTDADKNTPVAEEQSVNKGETPDAKKSIGNVDSLPEGTTVAFKDPVDTTTPGDKDATVVVTYPDGSKDEVPVKVTVKDPSAPATDADKNTPVAEEQSVNKGDTPDAKKSIGNVDSLPEGTTVAFKNPVDTTTPGDKDATVVVTYPDGSKDEVPVKVTVKDPSAPATDADKNTPVAEEQSVNKGDTPDAKKSIGNVDSLPEGTTVAFKDPVDTTTPGDKDATVVVTYPDGSKDEVPVKVTVKDPSTDADKNTPVAEEQSVNKGDTPDAKKSIGNVDSLPEGTTVAFKDPVDTTTPGDKDATVVVTYPDGSKDEVPVKVTVKDPSTDADKNTPVAEEQSVNKGDTPDAKKSIGNVDSLPEGTTVAFKNPVDTTTPGDKDATVVVTYPDGSKDEVPVKVTVKDPSAPATDADKNTPVAEEQSVNKGETPDAKKSIGNVDSLPEGTTVAFKDPVDTTTPGDKDATVVVTYPDGSKDEVPVKVTVKDPTNKVVKDPSVTPVTDPSNLTDAEKAKVADEVKKSNPTVTDVKVGKDGTTTVTYPDGSTAVIPSGDTVKKSSDNAVKTPSVTPVANPSSLTDAEKAKVADEVKKSNPTVSKVEVGNDGTTTVTYPDGTTAVIPADKTVKKSDDKAVKDPTVTPVIDPSNLTDAEKAKVADEVKKSNPTVTDVKVDKDGTTTVTYPDGTTAVIPADKTVKKSDDKAVKDPTVTPVIDPSNLTDAEKAKVADEVKKANPTVTDVKVGEDGTTTVTYPGGTTAVLPSAKTVKRSVDKELKDPTVTPVTNPSNLTDAEKAKVADEVKKSNPTVSKVEVGNDGTTTVTYPDGTTAVIPADKTVKKSDDKAVKDPSVTPVTDPSNLTDAEKAKVADEVKKANPTVTDVKVDKDGTTTVTYPDGTTAVIPADNTVKKSDDKGTKDPSVTPVTDPSNLTDAEKAKVADEVKKANPTVTDVKVDKDGTTTVTYPDGTTAVIPADKAVKKSDDKVVTDPSVTPVTDPSNLTGTEKAKVADEVKKSNPTVSKVEVGNDGTTTVTYPDGTTAVIPADKAVKKSDDKVVTDPSVTPVTDPSNLTDIEKAKVADEVKKANPTVTDVKVDKDGTTTVTYPDGTTAVIPADKTVKKSDDKAVKDPSVTPVADPSNLTDAEKAKVADEVKKSNPTVSKVEVGNDGTTTVTYPDGTTAVVPADNTVKKSDDKVVTDPSVTPVTDPSNLTDAEKAKVADEVKKSNPTVSKVEVDNDGTTTVTYPDGTTAVIPADKTVKKSDDKVVTNPSVTPVTDPSNLTDAERAKVAEEVKKANPTAKDIKVNKDGSVVVTFKDGSTAVIPSDKTVKKSADKAKESDGVKNPSVTAVTDPSNLTDAEKAKVADEVKKANPTAKDIKVNKDGSVVVTFKDGSTAVIPSDKTVKKSADKAKESDGVKNPSVTAVTDPSNLTDAEKAKVAEEVKKANPTAKDIKVNNDGSVVVTFKDGTTAVIPADKTVKKSADKAKESDGVKNPSVTPVTDPSNLTDSEKAKVAEEVKKANPTAKDIKVNNDGSVVVTFADGSVAVIPAEKAVTAANQDSPAQAPAKKAGAKELPNTGTKQSSASLALALLAAATGGLLIAKKREEEE